MSDASFTIGRLADSAAVNIETVRYYHRRGLLPLPPRASGKVRRYGQDALHRLNFIRRAQRLGFSLNEIEGLLSLDDGQSCGAARAMAEQKLAAVDERLQDLKAMRKQLVRLIATCAATRGRVSCPIIRELSS